MPKFFFILSYLFRQLLHQHHARHHLARRWPLSSVVDASHFSPWHLPLSHRSAPIQKKVIMA